MEEVKYTEEGFKRFQETGTDVEDLSVFVDGQEGLEGKPGRMYADGLLYIEKEPDGRWFLCIANADWIDTELKPLERHLYEFAVDEGYNYED